MRGGSHAPVRIRRGRVTYQAHANDVCGASLQSHGASRVRSLVIVTSRRTRQACGARSCLQPHTSSKFCWARYSQSAGRTSILLCVELHRGCGPWKSLHATRLAGRCVVAVPGEVQAVDGVVAMLVQVWRSSGVARPRAPF
jgi:hypothetical protein